jgi:hypothetical protein
MFAYLFLKGATLRSGFVIGGVIASALFHCIAFLHGR